MLQILKGIKSKYEKYYGVDISSEMLSLIIDRCTSGKKPPDDEITLLDMAANEARSEYEERTGIVRKDTNDRLALTKLNIDKAMKFTRFKTGGITA